MIKWLVTAGQVAFFVVFAKLVDLLVSGLHLPIPGSIAGILLLFALLKLKVIRLAWIEQGSKWLIAEMLLFFIPAAVGIVNYKPLVASSGWQIALTIILSTVVVMICSGWIGERVVTPEEGKAG